MKKLKAYSLIELLVVMAIISFLVVGAWAALQYGLTKSRDTQREKAVRGIQTAAEAYYSDHGDYASCGTNVADLNTGDYDNACYLEAIAGSGGPLATYLDGSFQSPLPGGNSTTNAMAYYYNSDDHKYAVCTLTEVTHADGDKPNYYAAPSGATGNGCFCLGPGADTVKCAGLTDVNGS